MKVLITGVTGQDLECNDYVYGIDDFSSSHSKSLHLSLLKKNPNFSFYHQNINDDTFWKYKLNTQFDIIYNFACPASPPLYQKNPVHTLLTCTTGVNNVLNYARYFSDVVVHASTSEVYGDPKVSQQSEEYYGNVNSYGPRACYDEGKRAAEALCYDYLNKYKTDVRVVRIFNTYGEHMRYDDGRVITNFVWQALNNLPFTIYGDGKQTRSFCYISDLVNGIIKMAKLQKNPLTPINLGNPDEFTINELVMLIQSKIIHNKIIFKDLPINDPKQRKPDITKAKNILNWEPKILLSEGLDNVINYFRMQL